LGGKLRQFGPELLVLVLRTVRGQRRAPAQGQEQEAGQGPFQAFHEGNLRSREDVPEPAFPPLWHPGDTGATKNGSARWEVSCPRGLNPRSLRPRRRTPQLFTPKALYSTAQGKRSATLGRGSPTFPPTPQGLYNVGLCNPFAVVAKSWR